MTTVPLHIRCAAANLLMTKRTHTPLAMHTPGTPETSMTPEPGTMNAVYGWGQKSAWSDDNDDDYDCEVSHVRYLSEGGFNCLWLVTTTSILHGGDARRFVLRVPGEDCLLPHQLLNEVSSLQFVDLHLPNIPVPKVYAFDAGVSLIGVPFIAEEFINGVRLEDAWAGYTEEDKDKISRQLAEIVVDMAGTSFPGIGGLTLQHTLGPTIEAPKMFNGRAQFHSHDCYNIGPYQSSKEYVIACYDREIYYYTNVSESEIDLELFSDIPLPVFLETLRTKRQSIIDDDSLFDLEEPFVFCHGDLHGQNILVSGTNITAIIDFEFAGAFPLSELLGDAGVDVVGGQNERENSKWCARILGHVRRGVHRKGWPIKNIQWLLENRNEVVQAAKYEMYPKIDHDMPISPDERFSCGRDS